MKIGIVGNGVVGHAIARCYMEYHEVLCYDKVPEKSTHGFHPTVMSDIVFVCLPETELDGFFGLVQMPPYRDGNYVIKSTVPIGTTRRIMDRYNVKNLVHSPEFLTSRCAITDAQIPARNIIGVPQENHGKWPLNYGQSQLDMVYRQRFPAIQVLIMTSDESEAVKLFTNAFFAVKIAYFNEINLLSEKLGLDWESILKGILSDGRIAHSHTQVPGPDGRYGFGGACLPKDLDMLIQHIYEICHSHNLCAAAEARNQIIDRERT